MNKIENVLAFEFIVAYDMACASFFNSCPFGCGKRLILLLQRIYI